MRFTVVATGQFSPGRAFGFGLAASSLTRLSVVNSLIRPAGLSPAWLPASPALNGIIIPARVAKASPVLEPKNPPAPPPSNRRAMASDRSAAAVVPTVNWAPAETTRWLVWRGGWIGATNSEAWIIRCRTVAQTPAGSDHRPDSCPIVLPVAPWLIVCESKMPFASQPFHRILTTPIAGVSNTDTLKRRLGYAEQPQN